MRRTLESSPIQAHGYPLRPIAELEVQAGDGGDSSD
jgi:hypothetical protein